MIWFKFYRQRATDLDQAEERIQAFYLLTAPTLQQVNFIISWMEINGWTY